MTQPADGHDLTLSEKQTYYRDLGKHNTQPGQFQQHPGNKNNQKTKDNAQTGKQIFIRDEGPQNHSTGIFSIT